MKHNGRVSRIFPAGTPVQGGLSAGPYHALRPRYVIEQIRRVTGEGWDFYFYRTQAGAEADLVLLTPGGKMACMEIKHANAPQLSRGFYQTLADLKPDFKYVIIPEGEGYRKADGIQVVNLLTFLQVEVGSMEQA
jgi:uncharacterized protein